MKQTFTHSLFIVIIFYYNNNVIEFIMLSLILVHTTSFTTVVLMSILKPVMPRHVHRRQRLNWRPGLGNLCTMSFNIYVVITKEVMTSVKNFGYNTEMYLIPFKLKMYRNHLWVHPMKFLIVSNDFIINLN